MDIFLVIVIFVIFVILFVICGWCCKRKREGTVYGYPGGTNVTVTTQPIGQSPVVVPPYPTEALHPTPHMGAPAPGFAPNQTSFPPQAPVPCYPVQTYYPPPMGIPTPYPPGPGVQYNTPYPPTSAAPYPPSSGPYSAHSGPYPPGPVGPYGQSQPPPYDVAVSQPPANPPAPTIEGYGKQAPYNPHYNI